MKTMTTKAATREQWLRNVARAMEPKFAALDAPLPKYRVSCSFPSTGGLARNRRTIGQCWSPAASADGTTEIFVSPTQDDPVNVAAVLAHEMVHAAVGTDAGHGPAFRRVAVALGLEGRMTATVAGEAFKQIIGPILAEAGDYPHAKLDASQRKKQTTRLVKCQCSTCGYTVRTTAKWLALGAPLCPAHGEMAVA